VGLERGPLGLVSTTEELLGRNISGSGLESREYGRRNHHVAPLYPQKSALTSMTNGGRSAGIVRSLTQATEFFISFIELLCDQGTTGYIMYPLKTCGLIQKVLARNDSIVWR
jgi:hypothetical protein